MASSIKTILARVPRFAGKSISYISIEGGITNRNYKVAVDDAAWRFFGHWPQNEMLVEQLRKNKE